ncbi:hypothetical protein GPJ56_005119 [Histomonas meleagridis]|uniref:uncharacterized protein n=1 Tax=Histomonas meleagridis TaxID=135588 RepID=UPI0035598F4F|nr:hypothetical protein GPJ56_005119 [Histomonas meleagridis]KAH0802636.1 hypothetical protein GO595_004685 [Histomonas meleagridis]
MKTTINQEEKIEDRIIREATEDAINSAFKFVRNKLTSTSDLESLELIKQSAYVKHQDKISFLKARVQAYVGNIKLGIEDLEASTSQLGRLLCDINDMETQSNEISTFELSEQFSTFHDLGIIWDNLNQINTLNKQFEEADRYIDAIKRFFESNPKGFSIQCFQTIQSLLHFESEITQQLLDKEDKIKKSTNNSIYSDSPNKDKSDRALNFLTYKFQPIHEAKAQLIENVHELFTHAFTGDNKIDTDSLVRAVWILIANGEKNRLIECIHSAICSQFKPMMVDPKEENLNLYLKQLNDIIDSLPQQIETMMPALPPEINLFELVGNYVNDQIVDVLDTFINVFKPSSFLTISLIKAMKDIQCTLRALLGINTGERFTQLIMNLQAGFEQTVIDDYTGFLSRIIDMDINSVSEKRNGIYYTPAPLDLIRRLEDAYDFVKTSELNILPSIRVRLVQILINKLYDLGGGLEYVNDRKYLIAVCNNSYDGKNTIMQISKDNPEIIEPNETKQLMQAWVFIMKKGLTNLFDCLYKNIIGEDPKFKDDFENKIDEIRDYLSDAQNHLLEPLFVKFFSNFCKNIVPHYICSYFIKPEEAKETALFQDKIKQECGLFIELFNDFDMDNVKTIVNKSVKTIEAFSDFMTAPFHESIHITYMVIAKDFTDFTPEIAGILLKTRPDASKQSMSVDECIKSFTAMYANVEQKADDHIFTDAKKPEKKFFK